MRLFAALSTCALALVADALSPDAPEAIRMEGDVWVDNLLQYRLMMDDTNATLLARTDDSPCSVCEAYDLSITVSKCLQMKEYAKLWLMDKWPISNARFGTKTFTYSPCSRDVSPVNPPTPISAPPRLEVLEGKTKQTVPGAVAIRVCENLDCGVLPSDIVVSTLTGVNMRILQSIRDGLDCPTPVNSVSCREGHRCQCSCPEGLSLVNGKCSCPGGQNFVNGVCTCPAGMTLVGGTCKCPTSQTEVSPGVCGCTGGQTLVRGTCTCTGGQSLVDGSCACTGGQTLVGDTCTCTGGQSLVDGSCKCTGGQSLVSGTCACTGGQTLVGGSCTCTGGQSLVGGSCTCTGGQSLVAGTCACTGGQSLVDGTCACTGGQSLESGVCECTGGQSLVSDVCTCPVGQSLVSGVCSCQPGMIYENGACTCTGGQTETSPGVCECTGGQSLDNGVCTCPAGQSLSNGVCSCPTGQSYESGACKCTGGQTETSPGVCECTGGQSLASGVCTCPAGQSLVNGVCSCPARMIYENGACACTGGQTETSPGVCECTGGQSLESDVCTCTGGQSLVNGVCSCPGDQSLIEGVCSCPGDQTLVGNVCSCPGDQTLIGNACSCPGDQTLVSNVCSCPGDQTLVGGRCSCPGDQTLVGNTCSCPGDQSLVGGVCSCPGDQTLIEGRCSCPGDQTLVGNICSCPGNQTLVEGRCSCPGDQTLVGNACSCPGDQSLVGGVCSCPGDQTLIEGRCSCPGGQTLVANVCSCPGDQTLVGGVCSCPGDQILVGNVCSCPGDQTLEHGVCSCPCDQTLIDGVCSCPPGQSILNGACSCPNGEHVEDGVCMPTCFWKENNVGFQCSWSDPTRDHITLSDDCKVHAPVPKDSYVNDGRTNEYDADKADPVIAITATRDGDTTGITHKAPWNVYAATPESLENEVTFSSFGVFDLSLTATDYRYHSTCTGCIAIVDDFAPTAKDKCKTSDSQDGPVMYSASNLNDAIAEEATFTAFYSPGNVINNGAYDPATGANERCDSTTATIQDFFTTSPSPLTSVDTTCFGNDFVTDLLDAKSNVSPLSLSSAEMNALQCTRCCSKSLTLQEYYYEYQCGTALADTVKKTATSDSCSFGYCLKMSSNALVTATAGITLAADAKTATIIAGLPTAITPGSKDIHRSITCTSFSDGCSYKPTLGELFDHSAQWGVSVPASYNVDDYMFWRYSVGTESWNSWDDAASLTFTEPETEVFVEAWTHCGQVISDKFKVILHAHSSRPKCAGFNDMWTELTAYPRTVESHMCAYPDSDFVLMQFAYDSEAGMAHDANTVKGKYTDVKCYVTLAASDALTSVTRGEVPLTWTPGTNGRIQVSKQLALELVHEPSTFENTDVEVQCDFTFTHYDASTTEVDLCPHSFSITDCDRPSVETYGDESVCKAGECLSPSGKPGPFEACSGSVFTTEGSATHEKVLTGVCCSECSTTLTCTALPESNNDGLERCEPTATGTLLVMALRGEGEWRNAATPTMMMSLLGASALVAVVALVVVKRRSAQAARGREQYDAYYPLLE